MEREQAPLIAVEFFAKDTDTHFWRCLDTALLRVVPANGEAVRLDVCPAESHSFPFVGLFLVESVIHTITARQTETPGLSRVSHGAAVYLRPADQEADEILARIWKEQRSQEIAVFRGGIPGDDRAQEGRQDDE